MTTTTLDELLAEVPDYTAPVHLFGGRLDGDRLRFPDARTAALWTAAATANADVRLTEETEGTCVVTMLPSMDPALEADSCVLFPVTREQVALALDVEVVQVDRWIEDRVIPTAWPMAVNLRVEGAYATARFFDGTFPTPEVPCLDPCFVTDAYESGRIPARPDWTRLLPTATEPGLAR